MRYWPQKPSLGVQINWGHPLARGIVGCWLMNENTGKRVFDSSGNGIIGSLENSAQFTSGKFGSAILFDDATSDHISLGANAQLDFTTAFSIAAWIKTTTTVFGAILGNTASDLAWAGYAFVVSQAGAGLLGLYTKNGGWTNSTGTVNDGLWHFVAVTNDSVNTCYYIDGKLDRTVAQAGATAGTGIVKYIGAYNVAAAALFDGILDNVLACNRILSISEIQQLYINSFCMFRRMPIEIWGSLFEDLEIYVYDTE